MNSHHRDRRWKSDFVLLLWLHPNWFVAIIHDNLYFLSLFINLIRSSTFSLECRHVFHEQRKSREEKRGRDFLFTRAFGLRKRPLWLKKKRTHVNYSVVYFFKTLKFNVLKKLNICTTIFSLFLSNKRVKTIKSKE